jgi:hypothetical protein
MKKLGLFNGTVVEGTHSASCTVIAIARRWKCELSNVLLKIICGAWTGNAVVWRYCRGCSMASLGRGLSDLPSDAQWIMEQEKRILDRKQHENIECVVVVSECLADNKRVAV